MGQAPRAAPTAVPRSPSSQCALWRFRPWSSPPSGRPALVLLGRRVVYNKLPPGILSHTDQEGILDLQLAGKSALITGASKGIGRATALTLAAEGCSLHLAARSTGEIESLRKEILTKQKVAVELHPGDLSSTQSMLDLANRAGNVDILINNA